MEEVHNTDFAKMHNLLINRISNSIEAPLN